MFAGVTSSSRATCPNTEMRRRDRRCDSEVRPVPCSTSSFRTQSYHRILSLFLSSNNAHNSTMSIILHRGFQAALSDTSGGKHPESSHQLIVRSRCLLRTVTQTKQVSGKSTMSLRKRSETMPHSFCKLQQ